MHMRKLFLSIAALVFFTITATAQNRTVTGKVSDTKGKPIPNASVVVKGTVQGTTTNDDGVFSLSIPDKTKILTVTAVGYATSAVNILGKTNVLVELEATEKNLEEVVVVGYGTQKKTNVTASVSKIGSEKVENKPFTALDQMLQGAAPGLQASSTTGQPGAVTPIRIRGTGSFSYSASGPLYIIDGVQINS